MAKFYYNDVLLPEIPADVLAEHPYCWIRNNTREGFYDLLFATVPWYLKDTNTLSKNLDYTVWYQIPIASAGTADAWTFNSTYYSLDWGNESDRRIMWSNVDIPNGSINSTDVYFYSSDPVPEFPEEPEEPEEPSELYYKIKASILSDLADQARRLASASKQMSPSEIVKCLAGITIEGGGSTNDLRISGFMTAKFVSVALKPSSDISTRKLSVGELHSIILLPEEVANA